MEAKPLCCPVDWVSECNNRIRTTSSPSTKSTELCPIFLALSFCSFRNIFVCSIVCSWSHEKSCDEFKSFWFKNQAQLLRDLCGTCKRIIFSVRSNICRRNEWDDNDRIPILTQFSPDVSRMFRSFGELRKMIKISPSFQDGARRNKAFPCRNILKGVIGASYVLIRYAQPNVKYFTRKSTDSTIKYVWIRERIQIIHEQSQRK